MPFFVVTMSHPDGEAWGQHLRAHVDYLQSLIRQGKLRASGRLKGKALRSGFLIFTTETREETEALIQEDPFTKEGLIAELTIHEWDPLFGVFAAESSGEVSELAPTGSDAAQKDARTPGT